MENRGEKENPCVRAFVALFSHESERSAEARKALRTRGEDGSSSDRRGKPKDMEETTGRRSLSLRSANANATVYTTVRLLHAYRRAIHWTPMNEHGRTRDGNFIRCNATRQSGCRTKRRRKRGPCTVAQSERRVR